MHPTLESHGTVEAIEMWIFALLLLVIPALVIYFDIAMDTSP
jgi:hypothetical protein